MCRRSVAMRRIWVRVAVLVASSEGGREASLLWAERRWEAAFSWVRVPEAMAARRAARLVWRAERRFWAAWRVWRAVDRARLVDSREEVATSAGVSREVVECWSWIRVVIWEESFSRTERASWMQSSRLERRIRASKVDVGCGVWGEALNGLEGGTSGSSRARSVKLV